MLCMTQGEKYFFICKTINKIPVGFEYLRKKYEF